MTDDAQDCSATFGYDVDPTCRSSVSDLDCPGGQSGPCRLNKQLTAGTVTKVITSKNFETPTTAAKFGNTLAVVQAKFDTGFPPKADTYEVVLVRA